MPEEVLQIICKQCARTSTITVPVAGYKRWQAGELIQRAMPGVSIGDRELLISGVCGQCFDKMFPPEEIEERR